MQYNERHQWQEANPRAFIGDPSSIHKMKFFIAACFIFVILLSSCDSTRSPDEKEARREEKRIRKEERRRQRQGAGVPVAVVLPDAPSEPSLPQTIPLEDQPGANPGHSIIGPCSEGTQCVRVRQCPFITDENPGQRCVLQSNGRGVCCPRSDRPPLSLPPAANPLSVPLPIPATPQQNSFKLPFISPLDIGKAVQQAEDFVNNMRRTEGSIAQRNLFAAPNSEEGRHQNFLGNDRESRRLSDMGLMLMKIIQALAKMMGLDLNQAQQTFQNIPFANSVTGTCPRPVSCFQSKYRTLDGSCNNEQNTDWGQAFTAFNRMLVPEYEDNFDAPRVTGSSGQQLPSARLISTTAAAGADPSSKSLTLMSMQWGQFLDHDITSAATSRSEDGRSIKCCGPEFTADPSLLHPACFPISVPSDDPFYARETRTCMSFVRSAAAPRANCAFGPREQLNQISSYIDASMVYGKSESAASQLRSFRNGMMKTSVVDGQNFLPKSGSSCGIPQDRQQKCFSAGDGRINVQANLVVIHAIFVRQHNNIASQLKQLNPNWNDETLFQETRRIVAAQIQHITYNEFLPVVVGQAKMSELGIKLTDQGYSNTYDPNTNAQILSAFSTAAYRMHTLIPKSIDFVDSSGSMMGKMDLSESYNNPSIVYEKGAFGRLTNGLVTQSSGEFDRFHTDQVSNHLFRPFGASSGLDLVAINIQRGRDHGLPGYNRFRTSCGLPPISSWNQMMNQMKPGAGRALQSLYASPDDVDLFVGGISEKAISGGLVGPTFACIIGEQFKRLRNGDRFWYENGGLPHSFTPQQVNELKKTSLSAILCDVGPDTVSIQPFSLSASNADWNRRMDCQSIMRPDLNAWANERVQ